MYLESQTQFGDIPWPREEPAGTVLNPTQPVADRVDVTEKSLSDEVQRSSVFLPYPKRFEKHLPLLVVKVAEAVQCSPDRFDHHRRRAHGSGGQDGAVEHRDRGGGVWRASQHHSCHMQGSWRIAQVPEGRT